MKPLKLTMCAFGSYADKQTIDFTQLGVNGLYLIAGETGSGKTTIFDAVSFALFGKASGTGREEYQKLRSDFADKKAKTYVELAFVAGGSGYHIKRLIKNQGQDVVLSLPDGTVMSGKKAVDEKIVEIAGLDRSQFAQIVMIAQNDFLRFLQSGTDERLKILRRIFGTEDLKQFQEHLKARAKAESEKREWILREFTRYNVEVYKREEQFAQWQAQLSGYEAELSEIDAQIAACDETRQELAGRLAVASEWSKKFSELAGVHAALVRHGEQAEEMAESEKKKRWGETALFKVKPAADDAAKAAQALQKARQALEAAKAGEAAALLVAEKAAEAVRELVPLEEAQAAHISLQKECEAAEYKLSALKSLQKNRAVIDSQQLLLNEARTALCESVKVLEELPSVETKQRALEQIALEWRQSTDKLAALTTLQAELALIEDKHQSLAGLQAAFEAANADFAAADGQYRRMEDIFLCSQAGMIASSLVEGEPCPVCGSLSHPAPAAASESDVSEAKLKKARAAKDKAQAERESRSAACGSLRSVIRTMTDRFISDTEGLLKSNFDTAFAGFIAQVAKMSEDVQEPAEKAGPLQAQTLEAKEGMHAKPAEMIKALQMRFTDMIRSLQEETDALASAKAGAEASLAVMQKTFESAAQKRDELLPRCASLQSETATLIKRFIEDAKAWQTAWKAAEPLAAVGEGAHALLSVCEGLWAVPAAREALKAWLTVCEDVCTVPAAWEEARALLAGLETQTQTAADDLNRRRRADERALKKLAADWEVLAKQKTESETDWQAAKAVSAERTANEQAASQSEAEAKSRYSEALHVSGFTAEAAYTDALLPEKVITKLSEQLLDYEKNGEALARDAKRLEAETAGQMPPDMDSLQAGAKAAETESAALRQRRDTSRNSFESISKALGELRRAASELEKAEESYAAVKQLADAANGRLDFETYAQMAYFERVLCAANKRLKLMSQNRYTLLRKEESGDKRSKTGLEIEVLDAYTGKARPANFLSGGESFMASLSLALGLSDVVQQNAGGVQLDAMFIDEGFGSLDAEVLELAVRTLSEMAGAGRIIGIISHVAELRERIDKQIKVEKTTAGSRISLMV